MPWLKDRKWCYIRMEGTTFGDVPLNAELKLEVWDSPNSAGVITDAIRCLKLGLDRGLQGTLVAPSSYFMKSPPIQIHDDIAFNRVEAFIKGEDNETLVGTETAKPKVDPQARRVRAAPLTRDVSAPSRDTRRAHGRSQASERRPLTPEVPAGGPTAGVGVLTASAHPGAGASVGSCNASASGRSCVPTRPARSPSATPRTRISGPGRPGVVPGRLPRLGGQATHRRGQRRPLLGLPAGDPARSGAWPGGPTPRTPGSPWS